MKIKSKILCTLLGMSLLVALTGVLAVNRQHAATMLAITKEAESTASFASFLLTSNKLSASAQEIIAKLHRILKRDVVLMDSNQLILADAIPSSIGQIFKDDRGDEVGETIKDGQARTFVEVSPDYPSGIKQIVVPVKDDAGQIIGAVILEYTPLFNEMMQLTKGTIHQVVLAAIASTCIALLMAFYIERSIAMPLEQLTDAATAFANGQSDMAMPRERKDEIGKLAAAFRNMFQRRQRAEDDLQSLRDALEQRVNERTTQLANANHALQAENTERIRAEETLRASNEKFHQLADNLTDAFWIRSADAREVQYISPAFERIWGRPIESLYANPQDWGSFVVLDDRARVLDAFKALTRETPNLDMEYRIFRPDGEVRWLHVRGFQVRDAAGKLIRLTGIVRDITAQQSVAEKLRESERRFSNMLHNLELISVMLEPDGRIIYCNNYLLRLTGWTSEEVIGRNWFQLFLPAEMVERLHGLYTNLLADDPAAWHHENEILTRSGARRSIRWNNSILRSTSGKVIGTASIGEDITERKQAEAARDRLAAILESTTDLVSMSDPTGRILYCNRACRNALGIGLHEDLSPLLVAHFLPDAATHPIVTEGIPTALREGIWSGETVLISRRGVEIPISQVLLAHKTLDGKIEFLSTIMRDITERKRLEAQLFQSQKMEMVGKLAGGVAHEFNSIMTAIIGQSELLLTDLPLSSSLSKNASEIRKAAERATILTRQLLAFGRKQIFTPEILDLNSVVSRMESTLRHLMGRTSDLQFALASGLGTVKADAGQIEQVIMNIAMNAADAMPNGGKFTLETANVTLDQDYVSRFPELTAGEYVMLAATDTGIGMSDEIKARAFDPFFSTKSIGQGAGLGLSTSYGIIKQSGGHLSIYSEIGQGTTLKIYLPYVVSQPEISSRPLSSPDLPRGTETILLVEDDPALREMAATLLRRLGYKVLAAADGIEALRLKKQRDIGHIDLLLTDVVMPHMSGKELAERVQALYPHMRILFASAFTENAIVHQGVLNKGVALLQKPFTPSALARKLREVLDQPGKPTADAVALG